MTLRTCRGCGSLIVRVWAKAGGKFEYHCDRFNQARDHGHYAGEGPRELRDGCWKAGEERVIRMGWGSGD